VTTRPTLRTERRALSATFAIRLLAGNRLIGSVGLKDIDRHHSQAELGFWSATQLRDESCWGPACSGKVCSDSAFMNWERYEDVVLYAALRDEWH
jgi:RimJ/RimL family protein N-acetyltransferase